MSRRPLCEIDPNRVSGNELPPRIRDRIAGAAACGVGSSTITKVFKIPESTVRKTIKLDPIRQDNASLPRSGKPREITRQLERRILRFIRRFPKFSYEKVRLGVPTTVSRASIYRILKKEGITNWICKKRPFLILDAVQIRCA
jgi:hypothetical protein